MVRCGSASAWYLLSLRFIPMSIFGFIEPASGRLFPLVVFDSGVLTGVSLLRVGLDSALLVRAYVREDLYIE
jgi:hypothetical protein